MISPNLRRNPGELGYGQNLWDGELLMHHIKEKFHTEICVRTCQFIFYSLEFRSRKPLGVIAKGDPE